MIKKLSKFSPATVHEALGRIGAVDYEIKPISRGMKICGPAFTVNCPVGDNFTLHKAIYEAKAGDVIVATVGNYRQAGCWGEITSLACKVRGINGLVVDGSIRDVREITELGFPVFSRAVCIKGTVKNILGTVNRSICLGGVLVNPGDIVLGDDDGIVIVPKNLIKDAIRLSAAREERERVMMEKIKKGATTIELLGLAEKLNMKI